MIDALHATLPKPVCLLIDSEFEFFPTGSRFFGEATVSADWDFFTEENPKVETFLLSNHFESITDDAYDDQNITKVYRRQTVGGVVDVQLVKNLAHKELVQRILKRTYPSGLPKDKATKKEIWKTAQAVLAEFQM